MQVSPFLSIIQLWPIRISFHICKELQLFIEVALIECPIASIGAHSQIDSKLKIDFQIELKIPHCQNLKEFYNHNIFGDYNRKQKKNKG